MNILLDKKALSPSLAVCASARAVSRTKVILSALLVAASVAMAPAARADAYSFSFSGGGLSGSGVLDVSNTAVPGVPGAYQITGISGLFSDTHAGISNAAITGLHTTSLPSPINADGTFVPPGQSSEGYGFSYDNLFYPAGDSPWVCPPPPPGSPEQPYSFHGGVFDIYGLLFSVQGGYSVDLWSNGVLPNLGLTYGVGDSLGEDRLNVFGEPFSGPGVALSTSPVPEPGSLILLGTGVLGLVGTLRRKINA